MDSDWHYKSISEIHEGYRSLKILPSELVSHFYDRIEKLDSKLSAYVSLSKDQAYKDAKLMDQNIQNYIKPDHFDAIARLLIVVATTWFFFFILKYYKFSFCCFLLFL